MQLLNSAPPKILYYCKTEIARKFSTYVLASDTFYPIKLDGVAPLIADPSLCNSTDRQNTHINNNSDCRAAPDFALVC